MDREAGSEEHSLISYQDLGAKAFATEQPNMSAGRNGTANRLRLCSTSIGTRCSTLTSLR
jgi:hypothetical protein